MDFSTKTLLFATATAFAGCSPPQYQPPQTDLVGARLQNSTPAATTGQVVLAWQAPDQRLSGESLEQEDIRAYRLYYGESPDTLEPLTVISPRAAGRHEIEGLTPGQTYYFAISAIDVAGREGERSAPLAVVAEPADTASR